MGYRVKWCGGGRLNFCLDLGDLVLMYAGVLVLWPFGSILFNFKCCSFALLVFPRNNVPFEENCDARF